MQKGAMTIQFITPHHKLSTNTIFQINVSKVGGNSEEILKIYPGMPFFSNHFMSN